MPWTPAFLPFVLLLTRVAAFVMAAPLLGGQYVPRRYKMGMAVFLTVFLVHHVPMPAGLSETPWLQGVILLLAEFVWGVALGMGARLVFLGISQGGRIAGRSMGMEMAQVIDPNSGDNSQPVALIIEMSFIVLFLGAGGLHVLVQMISKSYEAFPVAQVPSISGMTELIVVSGQAMLSFGLRLAGPIIAAGILLSVVLGIMARVLPEMNVLFLSLPLRVAVGLTVAAALIPTLDGFTEEISRWMVSLISQLG